MSKVFCNDCIFSKGLYGDYGEINGCTNENLVIPKSSADRKWIEEPICAQLNTSNNCKYFKPSLWFRFKNWIKGNNNG